MHAYWEVCSVYCKTQKEICLRHSVLRLLQSGQVGTVRLRILPLNNWRSHEVEFFLLWRSKRSLEEFRIQNWEKWSVRSEIIFPLVMVSSRLLAKRLSISEYELWCTLVGLSIIGVKLKLCKDIKIHFWAYLQLWKRRRLILKSPIKKICLAEALRFSK